MNEVQYPKLKVTAERLGIDPQQVPRHIAIIMDGNGRWAQKRDMPRAIGHQQGGRIVEKIALDCVALGIEVLTLYSFSIENWKRPQAEIDALMHLYSEYLVGIRPTLQRNNVKLVHLGRINQLPQSVQTDLNDTIKFTSGNTGMILALALNYGGRSEIADAGRQIAAEYKEGTLTLDQINDQRVHDLFYPAG